MKNNNSESVKTDHGPPVQYRIAVYPHRSERLQGLFRYTENGEYGEEWREIQAVSVNEHGEEIQCT